MADFNESLKTASLAILNRELSEEERTEFLELGAALGVNNVEDYLYILMIFKRHSDVLGKRFDEIGELERKINDTLESSVERILGEGAARIGADMGEAIADGAYETLTSFGEYHTLRGHTILVCFICLTSSLAYWLGASNFLSAVSPGGAIEAFLFLPAGWSVFFCGATYTFLWTGDHWGRIKKTKLYKTFLGFQVFSLLALGLSLL